jgi:hypothetical protein
MFRLRAFPLQRERTLQSATPALPGPPHHVSPVFTFEACVAVDCGGRGIPSPACSVIAVPGVVGVVVVGVLGITGTHTAILVRGVSFSLQFKTKAALTPSRRKNSNRERE